MKLYDLQIASPVCYLTLERFDCAVAVLKSNSKSSKHPDEKQRKSLTDVFLPRQYKRLLTKYYVGVFDRMSRVSCSLLQCGCMYFIILPVKKKMVPL